MDHPDTLHVPNVKASGDDSTERQGGGVHHYRERIREDDLRQTLDILLVYFKRVARSGNIPNL